MPSTDDVLWRAIEAAVEAASDALKTGRGIGGFSKSAISDSPVPQKDEHIWDQAVPTAPSDITGDPITYGHWYRNRYGKPAEPGSVSVDENSPLISILVPVYRPQQWYLQRCIESVQRQTWPHWELCMVDDYSEDPSLETYLRSVAAQDPRIKVGFRSENGGISAATNDALALASGSFTGLLDNDDELVEVALERVAETILRRPNVDVMYSDEDKLDLNSQVCQPSFKPTWSPDYLLSTAYTCHFTVIRTELIRQLGGLRTEFDGSQDYDVTLRATEKAREIVHIPEILYHWRILHGSAADDPLAKPWAHEASRRALQAALQRRGESAKAMLSTSHGVYHVRREMTSEPLVSIIIQVTDSTRGLARCIEALTKRPGYDNYELVIVDRASPDLDMDLLLDRLQKQVRCTVTRTSQGSSWASAANIGAQEASGEMLVFVDQEIIRAARGWLRAMVEHVQRPEIAAVGGRLLSPDGYVLHAGMVVGLSGAAAPLFAGIAASHHGYMTGAVMTRNYSAVSGTCMGTTKALFDRLSGFEESLPNLADIDYCLRAGEIGLRIVYSPLVALLVEPGITRHEEASNELQFFATRWKNLIQQGDPYLNPHLSRISPFCALRSDNEETKWNMKTKGQMATDFLTVMTP